MRNRNFHTPINLLVNPEMYSRLKMIARLEKTTMSKLVRTGIDLIIAQINEKNKAIVIRGSFKSFKKAYHDYKIMLSSHGGLHHQLHDVLPYHQVRHLREF